MAGKMPSIAITPEKLIGKFRQILLDRQTQAVSIVG
jgi:hypothetical protein